MSIDWTKAGKFLGLTTATMVCFLAALGVGVGAGRLADYVTGGLAIWGDPIGSWVMICVTLGAVIGVQAGVSILTDDGDTTQAVVLPVEVSDGEGD